MRLPSSGRIAFVCSIVGISLCHKASAEDPAARARSLLGRGRARMKAGDPGAAVSLLTQAKAAAPNDPEILMELGLAELRESNGERCRGEGCGWRDEARKDTTAAIAAARTPAERAAAEFNLGL